MKIRAKNTSSIIDYSLINIICNIEHKNSSRVADLIVSILKGYNANFIRQDISPLNRETEINFNKDATFVITIGGDGTFLATALILLFWVSMQGISVFWHNFVKIR